MSNTNEEVEMTTPIFRNETYDRVKTAVQVVLPALATLYYAIATIWGLPSPEEIVATITAVTTALGVVLRVSSKQFAASEAKNDGVIEHSVNEAGTPIFSLVLNGNPYDLIHRDKITFQVKPVDDLAD